MESIAYQLASPIFTATDENRSAAVEKAVGDLTTQARKAGSEGCEAVEFLMNIAAGNGAGAELASKALLTLYRESKADDIRANMREQAFRLFEVSGRTRETRSIKNLTDPTPVNIPTPFLGLAREYAREKKYAAAEQNIMGTLVERGCAVNFGADPQQSRSQSQAMLVLYGDPRTSSADRSRICEHALKQVTVDTLKKVPTPTLYLAGLQATTTGDPRGAQISAVLCERTGLQGEEGTVLSYGRTIPVQEITAGVDDVSAVGVDDSFSLADETQRSSHLANMAGFLDEAPNGGPHVAFVNVGGNHWVTLTLCHGENGKLDCVVFDSNKCTSGDHDITTAVREAVTSDLKGRLGNFKCVRVNMQEKTAANACGVFAVDLVQRLDRALSSGSCDGTFDQLVAFVEQHERDWNAVDADAQQARVRQVRVHMLDRLTQAEHLQASQDGSNAVENPPVRETKGKQVC